MKLTCIRKSVRILVTAGYRDCKEFTIEDLRVIAKGLQEINSEKACREYLFQLRWPDGFQCHRCQNQKVWKTIQNLYYCLESKIQDIVYTSVKCIALINNLSVKFSPNIEYDFQITDTDKEKYRNHQNKFLLKLISKLTPKLSGSAEDSERTSIPDGAIYDKSTVILIETKTQNPLYENQVKRQIKNYAPDAIEIEIIWEEIFDLLHEIAPTTKDNFLKGLYT